MNIGKKSFGDSAQGIDVSRRHAGLLMLSATALAACGQKVQSDSQQPVPSYASSAGQVNLSVASFDIIIDDVSLQAPSRIGQTITPSPAMQLSQWATETIHPAGQDGNALLTITKASMTEIELEGEESFRRYFINEQRFLITVTFEAVLQASHPQGNRSATLSLVSSAEKSIADDATLAEADQIKHATVREAIKRFDEEMRLQFLRYQGDWPLYKS